MALSSVAGAELFPKRPGNVAGAAWDMDCACQTNSKVKAKVRDCVVQPCCERAASSYSSRHYRYKRDDCQLGSLVLPVCLLDGADTPPETGREPRTVCHSSDGRAPRFGVN